ncbi:hypothetical protein AJ87_03690 [Rhizobium yanglingense]|nr:hypothetical protein AJ87_03690 [Rhizobium yanglingense]
MTSAFLPRICGSQVQMNMRCLIVEYVEELGSQRLVHGLTGEQPLTAVVSRKRRWHRNCVS